MGGGGESNYAFYSVKLCVMINSSFQHNVLCLSFVVVLYSMYSFYVVMKEVAMCNKNLRLKSPFKVNRPLEFIEAP